MKISEKFPQFKKNALIMVSGLRAAQIYHTHLSAVRLVASFEVKKRQKGSEGLFTTRGHGKTIRSGTAFERHPNLERKNLVQKLIALISKLDLALGAQELYLLAPSSVMVEIRTLLPRPLNKKIVNSIRGNYIELPPAELLKLISKRISQKTQEKIVSPVSSEASSILKRSGAGTHS